MIQEKKQPVPPTRGMDSTGWKKGWFQLAMLGGSACTLHKVVVQDDGREAAKIWIDYHRIHSKKNTVRSYRAIIERFVSEFGDGPIDQVTPEQIIAFYPLY